MAGAKQGIRAGFAKERRNGWLVPQCTSDDYDDDASVP
jgi:hypothetical protein